MKRIIIIDDDPGIQDSISLVFSPAEYDVTIYPDADAVLDGVYKIPDLFIIDKQLSGVDGLDVCKHLKKREDTKHVPIIMMSASPAIGPLAHAACADDFVEKPYTISQLRTLAAKHTSNVF